LDYVLSLSYGKDSLACLGAIEKLGWPLDRIVTVDLWATDTIPADLPPMVEFKEKADKIIKERWGISVEHVRGPHTAEQRIYRRRIRGNRTGEMVGWPRIRGCEIQSSCKREPLSSAMRGNISYWGIAADEPKRIEQHSAKSDVKMPLVVVGWSEADCRKWCESNSLLSPIYTDCARGGCWFCPQQRAESLRLLRKKYPEYWEIMLKWDSDSPMKFKPGRTLHDYETRFRLEDEGLLFPDDKVFRWDMLDQELNLRLF
jgi:3'-phosphoadenosine 5'-phosphosulfate sulfotransferase (PAPS reductase)/FAD synthetase